ncbi:HVA22-like protein i [Linum grandiflorum]
MLGSFITRGLVSVFGYAYPAYECYKTVELNKPEIEQLRFWCQYWILVALLTVSERIGDAFISWVPMYSEAKLAFFIYLWYPKTKGTAYVYDSFFRPYIAKHENEIDRNLLELKTRAGDMAILYWQRAASYCQTRVIEIVPYVAAQSAPKPSAPQQQEQQQQGPKGGQAPNRPSNVRNHKSVADIRNRLSVAASKQAKEAQIPSPSTSSSASPSSSSSSGDHQMEVDDEVRSKSAEPISTADGAPKAPPTTLKAPSLARSVSTPSEPPKTTQGMQVEAVPSSNDLAQKETVMGGASRATRGRGRLRKAISGPK